MPSVATITIAQAHSHFQEFKRCVYRIFPRLNSLSQSMEHAETRSSIAIPCPGLISLPQLAEYFLFRSSSDCIVPNLVLDLELDGQRHVSGIPRKKRVLLILGHNQHQSGADLINSPEIVCDPFLHLHPRFCLYLYASDHLSFSSEVGVDQDYGFCHQALFRGEPHFD